MTAAKQIDSFLAKYTPEIAAQGRACLKKMRKRLPHAIEMVYDYSHQLVIGFGSTENGSEAVCALVVALKGISLGFNCWKSLPDPEKRLSGSGKQVRSVPLETAATLDDPYVETLMEAALAKSKVPMDPKARHRIVIKSNSAK